MERVLNVDWMPEAEYIEDRYELTANRRIGIRDRAKRNVAYVFEDGDMKICFNTSLSSFGSGSSESVLNS